MKHSEILNEQNAQETPVINDQLFKTKHMTGTPFHVLLKDDKYFLTLGNKLMTDGFNSEAELELHIEQNQWLIITTLCCIVVEKLVKDEALANG